MKVLSSRSIKFSFQVTRGRDDSDDLSSIREREREIVECKSANYHYSKLFRKNLITALARISE